MIDLNEIIAKAMAAARNGNADSDGFGRLPPGVEELRQDGIRFVLETREREGADFFYGRFVEVVRPEFEFELKRLFRGSEEEDSIVPGYDLARFWLLKVLHVGYSDMEGNPFEVVYDLIERLGLHSAQPDIPFTNNFGVGFTPPSGLSPPVVLDRAWSLREMNVPAAWNYSIGYGHAPYGQSVRIGHPDTGYTDHIDLDAPRLNIGLGYDFVDGKHDARDPLNYWRHPGHGLATGSVIMSSGTVIAPPISGEGGTGGPGKITGVAPESELVPIRTTRRVFWILSSHLAQAIYHASQNKCEVVSISLGGTRLNALKVALLDAVQKNLIVVAAAGNGIPRSVVWPARYKECIALAASNINSNPWKSTSRGNEVDVSAPGEQVWRAYRTKSSSPKTQVGPSDGTSYATANAAGIAALWLAHFDRQSLIKKSNGSPLQEVFRAQLCRTAQKPRGWDTTNYGAGIIDALSLLMSRVPSITRKSDSAFSSSTDQEDAESLISEIYTGDCQALLARIVGVEDQNLESWFLKYGPEFLFLLAEAVDAVAIELEGPQRIADIDASQLTLVLKRRIRDAASGPLHSALSPLL